MKGIVLAGGSGTRLFPSTISVSKQLLPVYDKPTIFYPISVLMLAGIREILIISTPRDLPLIKDLMGNGDRYGVKFEYAVQAEPRGIADAFLLGGKFLAGQPACLILGDNLFYGAELANMVSRAAEKTEGATVFAYHVNDPERFGVVEFDSKRKAISIEEKPQAPRSNWVVTGLYFYDTHVCEYAKTLKPSKRNELEITDLNKIYLQKGQLEVQLLGRGFAWLDTGTHEALLQSTQFVQTLETRQGLKIACLEEIALFKKFITREELLKSSKSYPDSSYGIYVKKLARGEIQGPTYVG